MSIVFNVGQAVRLKKPLFSDLLFSARVGFFSRNNQLFFLSQQPRPVLVIGLWLWDNERLQGFLSHHAVIVNWIIYWVWQSLVCYYLMKGYA